MNEVLLVTMKSGQQIKITATYAVTDAADVTSPEALRIIQTLVTPLAPVVETRITQVK